MPDLFEVNYKNVAVDINAITVEEILPNIQKFDCSKKFTKIYWKGSVMESFFSLNIDSISGVFLLILRIFLNNFLQNKFQLILLFLLYFS